MYPTVLDVPSPSPTNSEDDGNVGTVILGSVLGAVGACAIFGAGYYNGKRHQHTQHKRSITGKDPLNSALIPPEH
jgi:hypothetical protein